MSSGGTSSVVHTDSVDNIICVYRGQKHFILVDTSLYADKVCHCFLVTLAVVEHRSSHELRYSMLSLVITEMVTIFGWVGNQAN